MCCSALFFPCGERLRGSLLRPGLVGLVVTNVEVVGQDTRLEMTGSRRAQMTAKSRNRTTWTVVHAHRNAFEKDHSCYCSPAADIYRKPADAHKVIGPPEKEEVCSYGDRNVG